jgi:hypothetical protein
MTEEATSQFRDESLLLKGGKAKGQNEIDRARLNLSIADAAAVREVEPFNGA